MSSKGLRKVLGAGLVPVPGTVPRGLAGMILAVLLGAVAGIPAWGQEQIQGDRYVNSKYGVQIAKPPGWHFITAKMIVDLAKKQSGAATLRGEEDPVRLAGFAVIVSKVPSIGPEIAPHAVVMVHEVKGAPESVVQACEGLRTGMTNPETVEPTQAVQVTGRPAARLNLRGFVEGAAVRATALCTFRDRQAFVVVGQALASDYEADAATLETILASFQLK